MMVQADALSDLQDRARDWARAQAKASSVEEAEELAEAAMRAVGEAVVEELVEQTAGRSTYEGSSRPCRCGHKALFVSYRARNVATTCGVVRVERAYYRCRHCRMGSLPWDEAQGLSRRLWTRRAKAVVAEVSARLPYAEAVDLLSRLTPLSIEESSAELIVEEVGGRVRQAERTRIDEVMEGHSFEASEASPDRLYVAMDGSHAHIDGAWHEVKTGTVFEAEADDRGIDTAGAQQYVSAQEPAERFGERLYAAAVECGVDRADDVVVIGDGAEWIWNLADEHYPGATQIVDYYHACEHVYDLAKALYGEDSPQGKRWARERCQSLKTRGPTPLLRALRRRARGATGDADDALRNAHRYFGRHAQRRRYPRFRERGLMMGSGPVEAACKNVVGHRLKRAGMQWTHDGANHILALRCLVLNRRHDLLQKSARAAA
jgi:hypothetical protein